MEASDHDDEIRVCGTCRFWHDLETVHDRLNMTTGEQSVSDMGDCRRFPPVPMQPREVKVEVNGEEKLIVLTGRLYPETGHDETACGEWKNHPKNWSENE